MITIPKLKELYDSVIAEIEATYADNIPTFGKNFLRALSSVLAAKFKLYYLAIANLQKNIFVDTADPESGGGTLERFGRIKLGRNPFAAVAAQYKIQVTGIIGATVPAQQTFKSDDNSTSPGRLFIFDVAYVLIATTDTITVRALAAGLDSRLAIGNKLTATSPIANVNSSATVTVEVIVPQASEDIEEYRRKALESYRLETQGGAGTDYRIWSFNASGVKQTYPYAKTGFSNEINLYVEANLVDSVDNKGTPSAATLLRVSEVVEFDPDQSKLQSERGRRPLGVLQVNYLAITTRSINIQIPGYKNLTVAIQTTITNALKKLVGSFRPFVPSCDIIADRNDVIDVNRITSAILVATPGASFGTVVLIVDMVSMTTYTFINGDIPDFNTLTFT